MLVNQNPEVDCTRKLPCCRLLNTAPWVNVRLCRGLASTFLEANTLLFVSWCIIDRILPLIQRRAEQQETSQTTMHQGQRDHCKPMRMNWQPSLSATNHGIRSTGTKFNTSVHKVWLPMLALQQGHCMMVARLLLSIILAQLPLAASSHKVPGCQQCWSTVLRLEYTTCCKVQG
jgi:hypothetical protein